MSSKALAAFCCVPIFSDLTWTSLQQRNLHKQVRKKVGQCAQGETRAERGSVRVDEGYSSVRVTVVCLWQQRCSWQTHEKQGSCVTCFPFTVGWGSGAGREGMEAKRRQRRQRAEKTSTGRMQILWRCGSSTGGKLQSTFTKSTEQFEYFCSLKCKFQSISSLYGTLLVPFSVYFN